MNKKYDLTIAHRVCPVLAKVAVGYDNKRDMVIDTVRSMATALSQIKVRFIVILDGCPDYRGIFEDAFANRKDDPGFSLEMIDTPSIGNKATWRKQLEVLSATDSDIVYFSEDDYLYAKNAFRAMLDFISRPGVDAVTPLDHPGRYNGDAPMPFKTEVRVSRFGHWCSIGSTCLTFMARRTILDHSMGVLERYSVTGEEGTMWCGITKEKVFDLSYLMKTFVSFATGRNRCFWWLQPLCAWRQMGIKLLTKPKYSLWAPLPTLAVHLCNKSLSPGSGQFFTEPLRREVTNVEQAYLRS